MDSTKFAEILANGLDARSETLVEGRAAAEVLVASNMALITAARETSMPQRKPRHRKRTAYWWTEEIADLRRRCLKLRREVQRARNRAEVCIKCAEHKIVRRALRRAINISKARCWRKLGEDIIEDPWELGYKLVIQKLGALKPIGLMDAAVMEDIVTALFPSHT